MKIIVDEHKIKIIKNPVNEKEINISECEFEFADEITEDFVKEAYFTLNGTTYKQNIIDNKCSIPYEVLEEKGEVEIGVVAYLLEDEEYIKRYNPEPDYISTLYGSLKDEYENTEKITPTDKEQMEQALQNGLNEIDEALTDLQEKVDNGDFDGQDGQDGVSLDYNWNGTRLGIKKENEQEYEYVNLKGDTGASGSDGQDGYTPIKGIDYFDGQNGTDGVDGVSPLATVTKSGSTATISITDKNGTTTATISDGTDGENGQDGYTPVKGVDYFDGEDGNDGADATINGVNTLNIEAGSNITLDQDGNTLTISSTGGGGGSGDATVIYMGKINQYNTSAKALDITNYPANTRIILKHDDDTRSMYLKFKTSTKEVTLTPKSTDVIANNLYYLDVNSISSSSCGLAFTWCQTYEFGQLISIYKGVSCSGTSWTVNTNQNNLLISPVITLHENSSGNLSNTELLQLAKCVKQTLAKTNAIQEATVRIINKNLNTSIMLALGTTQSSTIGYAGTYIERDADTNGYYNVYGVNLRFNFSTTSGVPSSVSNVTYTKTLFGHIFDETAISGYDANATQVLKNVNGTLTWVTE